MGLFDFELPSFGDVTGWLFGSEGTAATGTTPAVPGSQGAFLPLLQGGLSTFAALNSPDTGGYGNTQAGFEASLQLQKDKLAQDMAIAQLQAQSAGSGSGAALEAAKIAARVNMAALREKAIADRLALKYQVVRGEPEMLAKGYEMMQRGSQQTGQAGLEGYNRAAQLLQGFRS